MSERPPAPPPGDQPPSTTDPSPGGGSPPGAVAPPPPPPPPSPPPPPVAARRVYRRTQGRVIAGVAGGIADYLGIEAWVVRIGFVVLVPFGGFGALAYLIAWLLMPPAGGGQSLVAGVLGRPSSLRSYLGVGLILLAVAILASAFSEPGVIWAMALIAFGIFLFRQDPEPSPPGQRLVPAGEGAAAGSAATTVPAATATAATTEPLPRPPAADQATTTLPGPPDVPVWTPPPDQTATWGGPPPLPPDHPAATWGAPPPRAPRRRPFLGPLTFAVALIVTGLALVLDNLDVVDLGFGQVLAVFLTVLGGGLLVGTWWGRAWGLIPVGLLALPVVALAMLAGPVPVEGGVAERLFQPRTPAEVRSSYRLAGGELILDLSAVRFGQGQPPVQASIAGGRLLVVLPDEVAAEIRGRVGVGSLDLLGHVDTGAQVDSVVTEPAARPPAKGAAPAVDLDLQAGYGVIEVRRASDPRSIHEAGPFEDTTFPSPTVPPTTVAERP